MLSITDYSNEFNYIREKTKDIVDCFYIGQSHNSEEAQKQKEAVKWYKKILRV